MKHDISVAQMVPYLPEVYSLINSLIPSDAYMRR